MKEVDVAITDRWRFAVIMGKFCHHLLEQGSMKSLGALVPLLVVQLNVSYTVVGLLISLQPTMVFLACPLAQLFIRKFGTRRVAILGGIGSGAAMVSIAFTRLPAVMGVLFFIAGMCSSMLYESSYAVLRQHFGEQFGAANTVSHLGTQMGVLTIPYLVSRLESYAGLFGCLLFIGGLFLNNIPIGAIFKPPRTRTRRAKHRCRYHVRFANEDSDPNRVSMEVEAANGDTEELGTPRQRGFCLSCRVFLKCVLTEFDLKALRNEPWFTRLWLPCQVLYDIVITGWLLFLVTYAVEVGIERSEAVYMPMAAAVGGFAGRIPLAIILHGKPRSSVILYAMCTCTAGVSLLLYELRTSLIYLLCCSFVTGIGMYSGGCAFYGAISIIVSERNFLAIVSISFFFSGIMTAVGGVLSGFIFDIFGSFAVVFRMFGVMMCAVSALILGYAIYHDRVKKKVHQDDPAPL